MADYDIINNLFDAWNIKKWERFANWKPNSISGELVRKIHKSIIFSYLSILTDILMKHKRRRPIDKIYFSVRNICSRHDLYVGELYPKISYDVLSRIDTNFKLNYLEEIIGNVYEIQ